MIRAEELNIQFAALGIVRITCSLNTNGNLGNQWITCAYDSMYANIPVATDSWYDLEISLNSLLEKTERKIKGEKK